MIEQLLVLALMADAAHVCVAGASGHWRCGSKTNPPVAELLPQAQSNDQRSSVPLLLIDPKRFKANPASGEQSSLSTAQTAGGDAGTTEATAKAEPAKISSQSSTQIAASGPPESAVSASQDDVNRPLRINPAASAARPVSAPSARRSGSEPSGGYTVQLVAARSKAGFEGLIRQLALSPEDVQVRRIQRGEELLYALCVGQYASMDAARAAVPHRAVGAFVRALSEFSDAP